jgi:LytS/YehU family sensor histidine kinase
VRFSDRLVVRFDVDDTLMDAAVPEFLLQPLVENALRHGIAQRADAGTVEVSARREGDSLILSVTDNGPGPHAGRRDENGNGLGLANMRERLTTLYGSRAQLDLRARPAPESGTLATVSIPFRRLPVGRRWGVAAVAVS